MTEEHIHAELVEKRNTFVTDNIAVFAAVCFPVCILLRDWEYNEEILEEMDYVQSGWKNEIECSFLGNVPFKVPVVCLARQVAQTWLFLLLSVRVCFNCKHLLVCFIYKEYAD